jgi:hypothetical protein
VKKLEKKAQKTLKRFGFLLCPGKQFILYKDTEILDYTILGLAIVLIFWRYGKTILFSVSRFFKKSRDLFFQMQDIPLLFPLYYFIGWNDQRILYFPVGYEV